MPGFNPAKGGRYDPFYTPPYQLYAHQSAASCPHELGFFGRLFRFVFFSAIFAFFGLIGLVFVEAAGGPMPFNFSLVETLDKASGWEPSQRNSNIDSQNREPLGRFSDEAERLREGFERMARDHEFSRNGRTFEPPEEFGWDEPLGGASD